MGENRESRDRESGRGDSGNGVSDANGESGANDRNAEARYSLERAIRGGRGGFYSLIASSRAQAAAIKRYVGENIALYDFSRGNRELVEISNLLDREPGRRAYVFLNFHLALWDSGKETWSIDAVRRLNFSRNALSNRGRTLIFCMTPEADALLNRRAYDFYDYIKLFFRFEDEAETAKQEIAAARPEDQSIGVDVKIDFSLPQEELLGLAVTLGNQAEELRQKARYTDALHLCEKQREIREQVLGKDHPDTVTTYNNIGVIYYDMGDYASALEWYQKARKVFESVLGKDHPSTATTYNNIAFVYDSQGDYARALEWFQKALVVFLKRLGTDHPYTKIVRGNIDAVRQKMSE